MTSEVRTITLRVSEVTTDNTSQEPHMCATTSRLAARRSRFQRGTGVYTCIVCEKRTRDTGAGEGGSGLCVKCWDYAGWENSHSDDDHDHAPNANCPVCKDLGLLDGPIPPEELSPEMELVVPTATVYGYAIEKKNGRGEYVFVDFRKHLGSATDYICRQEDDDQYRIVTLWTKEG